MACWVDSGGQVLKSHSEIMGGMVMYRTTEQAARESDGVAKVDQILSSIVKVTHKISNPETRRNVTYRLKLKDEDPSEVLPNDRRQTFRPSADKTSGTLIVKTAGPDAGSAGPSEVDPVFLKPNALINSLDARVVELAQKAIAGATDPWERVTRIEHWVAPESEPEELQDRVRHRRTRWRGTSRATAPSTVS